MLVIFFIILKFSVKIMPFTSLHAHICSFKIKFKYCIYAAVFQQFCVSKPAFKETYTGCNYKKTTLFIDKGHAAVNCGFWASLVRFQETQSQTHAHSPETIMSGIRLCCCGT